MPEKSPGVSPRRIRDDIRRPRWVYCASALDATRQSWGRGHSVWRTHESGSRDTRQSTPSTRPPPTRRVAHQARSATSVARTVRPLIVQPATVAQPATVQPATVAQPATVQPATVCAWRREGLGSTGSGTPAEGSRLRARRRDSPLPRHLTHNRYSLGAVAEARSGAPGGERGDQDTCIGPPTLSPVRRPSPGSRSRCATSRRTRAA
jgi:hypothetical protein